MTETQARTLPLQKVANRIVIGLLRVPLLNRLLGRRLVVLNLVGRKSGRHLRVPVAYIMDGSELLVGTAFGWKYNLRSDTPIDIQLQGRTRATDVKVIQDETGVVDEFRLMAEKNHRFADFNGIGLDAQGRASADDLTNAWRGGARAFRLSPR